MLHFYRHSFSLFFFLSLISYRTYSSVGSLSLALLLLLLVVCSRDNDREEEEEEEAEE